MLDKMTVSGSYGVPPLFVQGISVSGQSKNPATALAFAEYVTNNANQVAFVKIAAGFYPGTVEANDDPSSFAAESKNPLQNEATKIAASQMDTAQSQQPPLWSEAMNTYSKQQIALAVKGEISSQEALDKSVEYAQQQLGS